MLAAVGAVVTIACVGWVAQHLRHGQSPVDAATLIGLPVALLGLAAAVVALRKPVDGSAADLTRSWAATLARQVKTGEGQAWRQLLGNDTKPINLTYTTLRPAGNRDAVAPPSGRMLGGQDPGAAPAPDIAAYYRDVQPQRLVITGGPGAGKTTLALELMLALVEKRDTDDPVPVRISLAGWDTESHSLATLLTRHLVAVYDWPEQQAEMLVEHGRVLPVLDGLDEMDPARGDGTSDPAAPRARAVLAALNARLEGRVAGPFVLTCRSDHYLALAEDPVLVDAACVTIEPVAAPAAIAYLAGRARDASRWQSLLTRLRDDPDGPLARLLSTPWRLGLVATVHHRAGDPAQLLAYDDPDSLDAHLLARYVPAATALAPGPRRYAPDDVHRWLHRLAAHSQDGGHTDLVPYELWPMAGRARVRRAEAELLTLPILLFALVRWVVHPELLAVATIAGFTLLPGRAARRDAPLPQRLSLGALLSQSRSEVVSAAVGGVLTGLAAGLGVGYAYSPRAGVLSGVVFGLVIAVAGMLMLGSVAPPTAATPRGVLRGDLVYGLTIGISTGLGLGFATWIANRYLLPGPLDALLTGAAFGLAVGLMNFHGVAVRHMVFVLCAWRIMPHRPVAFMEWACGAGLLRQAGPAYQFRHRELHIWLAAHPDPTASSSAVHAAQPPVHH